jgi:hypothetical protein
MDVVVSKQSSHNITRKTEGFAQWAGGRGEQASLGFSAIGQVR